MIEGDAIRIVLRPGVTPFAASDVGAGPRASLKEVKPRFEDAFIDILGGAHGGESVLAEALRPREMDHRIVIDADELTRKFGDFVATDAVTFQVKRGEVFGLLGPNGAGKSTTFKMMCGLLRPTSGSARVMSMDLKKSAGRARHVSAIWPRSSRSMAICRWGRTSLSSRGSMA